MNKSFLYTGIASLLLVVVLIGTCPNEEEFKRMLEKDYSIVCEEQSAVCVAKGEENLELISTWKRDGVFFIIIKKTFVLKTEEMKVFEGFGILGRFWGITQSSPS